MPRTKGAKNLPKNPHNELKKVKRLFAKHGVEFPSGNPVVPDEQPVNVVDDPGSSRRSGAVDPLNFVVDSGSPAVTEDTEDQQYECGNCGAQLPGALPECNACGVGLNWQ